MRQQMLGVQARILDPAFFEISDRGLKNVEHGHTLRAPNAVILSRADGEGSLRRSKRGRVMGGSFFRAGLALSARLGMTINKAARRISIMRSARCLSIARSDPQLAMLKSFPRGRLP